MMTIKTKLPAATAIRNALSDIGILPEEPIYDVLIDVLIQASYDLHEQINPQYNMCDIGEKGVDIIRANKSRWGLSEDESISLYHDLSHMAEILSSC
jgi:hypothetical protein